MASGDIGCKVLGSGCWEVLILDLSELPKRALGYSVVSFACEEGSPKTLHPKTSFPEP